MKTTVKLLAVALTLSTLNSQLSTLFAQGTAFTYQGRLNVVGARVTGSYDMTFAVFDAASLGTQQGSTIISNAMAVSNGLFTVTLDFGNQFPGAARWLEIGVRTNGGGLFATLSPRQQFTSTPYAVQALNAAGASSVAAGNITGTLTIAQFPSIVVTNGSTGVSISGTFSGNGAGVTNVQATQLVGTIPTASLPPGVLTNTELGLTLSGSFSGSFSGNGVGLTNFNANVALRTGSNNFIGTQTFTGGNVGIGTNNPGLNNLQINPTFETANGYGLVVSRSDFGEDVEINRTNGQGGIGLVVDDAAKGDASTTLLLVRNNVINNPNSALFDVLANGNVGIGTTAPANPLDVQGAADFMGNVGIGIISPTVALDVNGTAAFMGAVGIGTAAPANPLDVQGAADFMGGVGIGTTTPGLNVVQINPTFAPANGYGLVVDKADFGENVQINRAAGGGGIGLVVDNAGAGDASTSVLLVRNDTAVSPKTLFSVQASGDTFADGTFNLNSPGAPYTTSIIKEKAGDIAPLILQDGSANNLFKVDTTGAVNIGQIAGGSAYGQLNLNDSVGYYTMTVKARPNDSAPLFIEDYTGKTLLLFDTAGNLNVTGTTTTGGQTVNGKLNVNAGSPVVTSTIRAQIGDQAILDVQTPQGLTLFDVNPSGSVDMGANVNIGQATGGSTAGHLNVNEKFNATTLALKEASGDTESLDVSDANGNGMLRIYNGSPNLLLVYGDADDNQGYLTWGTFSDERLKQDIRPLELGLKELMQVQTVRYRYRDGALPGMTSTDEHMGVIAQQVQKVFPEAAHEGKDGYLMLHADPIFWASVNAIQELNQKVEQKNAEVADLKNQVAELKQMVISLSEKVNGGAK
jgi:hypothetical protein